MKYRSSAIITKWIYPLPLASNKNIFGQRSGRGLHMCTGPFEVFKETVPASSAIH